jgi:hypothetical protein
MMRIAAGLERSDGGRLLQPCRPALALPEPKELLACQKTVKNWIAEGRPTLRLCRVHGPMKNEGAIVKGEKRHPGGRPVGRCGGLNTKINPTVDALGNRSASRSRPDKLRSQRRGHLATGGCWRWDSARGLPCPSRARGICPILSMNGSCVRSVSGRPFRRLHPR